MGRKSETPVADDDDAFEFSSFLFIMFGILCISCAARRMNVGIHELLRRLMRVLLSRALSSSPQAVFLQNFPYLLPLSAL